ncbi:MAG TPA: S8 family serine peptidase, partial [Chitinophagaceae bacterium]|nr:S8 family serine peptidase [Chitinophagaceae bacterium]
MKLSGFVPVFLSVLLLNIENGTAQIDTKPALLQIASQQKAANDKVSFQKLLQVSKEKGWKMMFTGRNGSVATLVGIDPFGLPVYVTTNNNIRSAATIRTNLLWTGGTTGLNLNGSAANLKGKIGIWDGGRVRASHVELVNRVIQKDNPSAISDHSTHVAGTMIATGVNPLAKGMSWGAQQLVAYDYNNDQAEMLGEAANLLVSNHSYTPITGWFYNETDKRWEFYGKPGENEDYKFGYYSSESQMWDSIAYNAPNYLIVFASGNNRNSNGPAVGEPYWRYDANGSMSNAGNRPAGINSNDAYDVIPSWAIAKNILTVGAINPIPSGYTAVSDAQVAPFSSWGPTDDGRIKPDVVADGVNLLSSTGSSDNAYAIQSGTSMAAPSATGSLLLLQEYYSSLRSGAFMRAATLKGIVIHTADEAGTAG